MYSTIPLVLKLLRKKNLICLVLAGVLASSIQVARAQQSELDNAASQLAAKIVEKGRKRVIVADFMGPKEQLNELGRQLADDLSSSLMSANKDIEVLPRLNDKADWETHLGEAADIREGNTARVLAKLVGAEVVIAGDMKRNPSRIDLNLRAWDIPPSSGKGIEIWESKKLDELRVSISLPAEREALLDRLLAPAPAGEVRLTAGLGRSPRNKSVPMCIDCPSPSIAKKATVKLVITISAEGRVVNTEVVEGSDQKVVEKVVRTVRSWRFQPARGPDGQPIVARVPVVINAHGTN
jgi:TonB family protein